VTIGPFGEKLIFIVSQPRAGSTLLQRILGSHPNIRTTSEPWLMLHPIYALRGEGHESEYDAGLAHSALQAFMQALPEGEEDYLNGLRQMYGYLYGRVMEGYEAQFFLDKTPRYYSIIAELYRIFPNAEFIFLMRNPLASMASMIDTWTSGRGISLYKFKQDLLRAPTLLLEGIELLGQKAIVTRYEDLVENPNHEVQRICNRMGVAFLPEMVRYGDKNLPRWQFGDQMKVYEKVQPDSDSTDKWLKSVRQPENWILTNDYLRFLGEETVNEMGYCYETLKRALEDIRPPGLSLLLTSAGGCSLKKSLQKPGVLRSGLERWRKYLKNKRRRGTVSPP